VGERVRTIGAIETAFDETPLRQRQIATETFATVVQLVALDGLWTADLERRGDVGPEEGDKESLRQIARTMQKSLSELRSNLPELLGALDGHELDFDRALNAGIAEFPEPVGDAFSELEQFSSFANGFRLACADAAEEAPAASDEISTRLAQLDDDGAVSTDFTPKFWCNLIAVGVGAAIIGGTVATAGLAVPLLLAALGLVLAEVRVLRAFGCWESLARRIAAAG
jgi:hypothetical protein